jgi:glycerol-3-phosphate cytidylyltransferase
MYRQTRASSGGYVHGVTGYTSGLFDLFHVGHVEVLRRSRQACDHLTVGVLTDELAEEIWGCKPFVPLIERLELVRHVRYVDRAVPLTDPDPRTVWTSLGFHTVFTGPDAVPGAPRLEDALTGTGVQVVQFTDISGTTSTTLQTALARTPARTSVA